MASAWIRPKPLANGKTSYVVWFRIGGRTSRAAYAGSFRAERDAKTRRDWLRHLIALGQDPFVALVDLKSRSNPPPQPTLGDQWEPYLASRLDVGETTRKLYRQRWKRIEPMFGSRIADRIIDTDIVEWVAANNDLAPESLRKYRDCFAGLMDYALPTGTANPVRSPKVKLRSVVAEVPSPPEYDHVLAILEHLVPVKYLLPIALMERDGMRESEIPTLAWQDVDVAGSQFRVRAMSEKTRKPKWVPVPRFLMDRVARSCPMEDRTPERLVFPGATGAALRNAMYRTCKIAEITSHSPHDLRHRRISLWLKQGHTARQVADWVGHSRPSMTWDRYSHVLMDDREVPDEMVAEVLDRRLCDPDQSSRKVSRSVSR